MSVLTLDILLGMLERSTDTQEFTVLVLNHFEQLGPGLYQSARNWHVRTVQRVNAQSVVMEVEQVKKEAQQLHGDTLSALGAAATLARVEFQQVLQSIHRYGNAPARVLKVLGDIKLLAALRVVLNPTGLFVNRMHRGEDIVLPPGARERQQAQPKPVVKPGMLAKLGRDVVRILAVDRVYATLDGPYGEVLVTHQCLRLA